MSLHIKALDDSAQNLQLIANRKPTLKRVVRGAALAPVLKSVTCAIVISIPAAVIATNVPIAALLITPMNIQIP